MQQKFDGKGVSNQYTFVRMYQYTCVRMYVRIYQLLMHDVIGSDVDFNSNPFNITINAGATDGRGNVSVICDNEVEGLESFDMTLIIINNSLGVILGRDICEGEINDSTGTVYKEL